MPIKDICAAEEECAPPTTTTTTTTTTSTTAKTTVTTTTTTITTTTTTAPGPVWRNFNILDSIPSAYDADKYNEEQAIDDLEKTICVSGFIDDTTVRGCTVESQDALQSRDGAEEGPINDGENLAPLDYISNFESILSEDEIADSINAAFNSYSGNQPAASENEPH